MRLLLDAHSLGRAEKLSWEFPFTFRGRPCSIASEKFGLRLYLGKDPAGGPDAATDSAAVARTVVSKLSAAVRCLERHVLSVLGADQVAEGNLTVHNQAGRLRGTYEYFRRLATDAYAGRGILARDHDERSDRTPFLDRFRFVAEQTEGLDAAMAMTVAYFSLLEHLLVLVLPATDFDPSAEPVTAFIRLRLLEKWDRVFGVAGGPPARKLRERLHRCAEQWRNPYGHGGFDKRNGTLSFHVPGVGALPVLLSDIRTHPSFRFVPGREDSFDQLCALFDEIDEWLRTGPVAPGMFWAESGLDVPFDAKSVAGFRKAVHSGQVTYEEFVMARSHAEDIAANMDW
jgi:hypothetical protein